ncbi:hypothetical protein GCM10017752_55560 [Streptomyces roseoviridis]
MGLAADRLLGFLVEQDHRAARVDQFGGGDETGEAGPDHDGIGVVRIMRHGPHLGYTDVSSQWPGPARGRSCPFRFLRRDIRVTAMARPQGPGIREKPIRAAGDAFAARGDDGARPPDVVAPAGRAGAGPRTRCSPAPAAGA